MKVLKVLKRFPRQGHYYKPGDVYEEYSDKFANLIVATGKAQFHNFIVDVPEPMASDSVKSLAEAEGVDLHAVDGSGKDGRILKRDVKSYMTRMMQAD